MENESSHISFQNNNFDLLRFYAATLVILSHSFSLLGYHSLDFLGELGVSIFLIISGYLITKSWTYQPHVKSFIGKRLLRILPNLILCILLTLFILGPVNTVLSLKDYFLNPLTWSYLKNISLFFLQFNLPGVFHNNFYPDLVNHSIWTLPLEFLCYMVVVLFGMTKILKKMTLITLVVILILSSWYLKNNHSLLSIYDITLDLIISYVVYFFMGAIFFLFKSKISYKPLFALLSLSIFMSPQLTLLDYIGLTYIILFIALLPKFNSRLFFKSDPSYGMYLFSMPYQQTIIHFFPHVKPFVLFFVSFLFCVMTGLLTWKYVESKVLGYKKLFFQTPK